MRLSVPCRTPVNVLAVSAFYGQRNTHATPNTQGGNPLASIAALHLVQQRDEDAAARRADGVADRNRAAVDVDLAQVPAHLVVHGAGLGGEGLVDLEQVQV